ncbi:MAG: sulfatase-like hydrolase/transferase [Planctomycetales bacterium]|nr:sulfatase-like hydrolase/transferase [Planctomycetales bacterium]
MVLLLRSLRFLVLSLVVVLGIRASIGEAAGQDGTGAKPSSETPQRVNLLWISCEDISPQLGCYGFAPAYTPNLDQLAREGARFDGAFTPAGVCAVVRSGVITGTYAVSIGSQHMRSRIVPEAGIRCFTEYLREAGYFCTNRSKTDYQFEAPLTAWDRQGNRHEDWREREPGQPFFSVINLTMTHESQVRHPARQHEQLMERLDPQARHDPDAIADTLPPYFPDTPAVRQDWAWYHDNISAMDAEVGRILARLEEDGLADNTLVVFWSDHGQGLPRGKRWLYDSGTHIPMIARWPGMLEPGQTREDLVSVLDLPATMLAVAGVERPEYFVGRVLLGPDQEPEPEYLFLHRDRMDEALDQTRGVRSRRFRYLRNYEPSRGYAQGIRYMDLMPTMREWREAERAGTLSDVQRAWFRTPKPLEEFYDLQADPHEVENLIDDPRFAAEVTAMRQALEEWQVAVGDQGMLPEPVQMERLESEHADRRTARPRWELQTQGDSIVARLSCDTPGASLAYRAADDSEGDWRLYVGPIEVPAGTVLEAIACRIGYRDSPRVSTADR